MATTKQAADRERAREDPSPAVGAADEWLDALERLETRAINLRADLERFADRSQLIAAAVTAIREACRDNTLEIRGGMSDRLRVLVDD